MQGGNRDSMRDGDRRGVRPIDYERTAREDIRSEYAIKRFEEEGIRYIRCSPDSDRFIVWNRDNKMRYTFFAYTGTILGPYEQRGIENMVLIAEGKA